MPDEFESTQIAYDVSGDDFACIMFQMNPETGGPSSYSRTQVLSLLYDPFTGAPAGVLTVGGYFPLAVIEDPYGGVHRGRQYWPSIEAFLQSEVLQ